MQILAKFIIADAFGWLREIIKNYIAIKNNIGTDFLKLAKQHQEGTVPKDGTVVPFDFTEWWFRDSGLYGIWPKYFKNT